MQSRVGFRTMNQPFYIKKRKGYTVPNIFSNFNNRNAARCTSIAIIYIFKINEDFTHSNGLEKLFRMLKVDKNNRVFFRIL